MNLPRALRIARHDAARTMKSWTYAALFLAPVLLALLMTFLVGAGALMILVVQLLLPEESPAGHNAIALVVPAGLPPDLQAITDELQQDLETSGTLETEQGRTLRLFASFLDALARTRTPAMVDPGHPPPPGTRSFGPDRTTRPLETDLNEVSEEHPNAPFEVTRLEFAEDARHRVPGTFDAALLLTATSPHRLTYEIISDPALTYSRTAAARVRLAIERFDGRMRRRRMSAGGHTISVIDDVRGPVDPWVVTAVLYLVAAGIAFVYHTAGMQSVATVLAGEREGRTIDVLLSLPMTWRTVLYGKVLGIAAVTLVPTLFWAGGLLAVARIALHLVPAAGAVFAVIVSATLLLTAIGCTVSATSSSVIMAKNRLSVINLVLFLAGAFGAVAVGAARGRIGAWVAATAAGGALSGHGGLVAWGLAAGLLAATAGVIEVGAGLARRM